ncbi:MAG: tetratricopeptide repeat protein [Candidatus Promineifilaceae bacterium]
MNSETAINPQFTAGLTAVVAYWQEQTISNTDDAVAALDTRRQNLYRAVVYGLKLEQTRRETAVVILQAFHLAERRGYWHEWIPLLQNAAAACPPDEPLLKADLLNRLGELYLTSRQLPASIESHLQAEAILKQTGEDHKRANDLGAIDLVAIDLGANHLRHHVWSNLSMDYAFNRQYDLAEQYGQQALAGFRATNAPPKFHANVLNALGVAAWWRGQYDRAETLLREAVAIWRELNQFTDLLRSMNNLMGTLKAARKYDDVWPCYAEAVTYFSHNVGEYEKSLIEVSYGGALYEQGQYDEAKAAFQRANSPYLQQSSYFYHRATVAQCLGNTFLAQNRLADAAPHLEESARLWRQFDDELMLANTLGTIAELYAQQGKADDAIAQFEQALALLAKYPDDAWAKKLTADFTRQLQEQKNGGQP